MAEAVISVMLENLTSLIGKEFGLLWGVHKEMEKLSSILSAISAVIEDAEERELGDKAIRDWLRKLKDVWGELDDVLDECSMKASLLEYKTRKRFGSAQKVTTSFLSRLNPAKGLFRLRIAHKMKDISERLEDIAKERLNFHLREVVVGDQRRVQVRNRPQTGFAIDEKSVYGREEDKDKIVEFLMEKSNSSSDYGNRLSIYPIVGMGGLGKTTLAQSVYNEERVVELFDIRMWVCVSEDFDVLRLVKAMIEFATGETCGDLDLGTLQKRLQEMLERKKFLLVLDDVWNEDQEKWDGLRNLLLTCGLSGSCTVVTTRLERVASIMGTTQMHHLSALSEDDCWKLFSQRSFGNDTGRRASLVEIGKEIVKKCKGNPLAAKSLGSMMHSKREEKQWIFVKESELWNLPQDETSILPALRLSYFHLPSQLRRCFAFCSIFPKDFLIEKKKLIHLWMANDLISAKENMEAEEMGNEIFNELYWRSFFQDAVKDKFGNIRKFKMHDLVHDLAQCILKDECAVIKSDSVDTFSTFYNGKSLRTLLYLWMSVLRHPAELPHHFNFCTLRAIDIEDPICIPNSLPLLISSSKHLRYLNLSRSSIKMLPKSICSLQSLQTLNVSYCRQLEKLPKHMSCLRNLRHLNIFGCSKLHRMPPNMGKLSCLRTLSYFIVDCRRGYSVDELGTLLNLEGDLTIECLEKVKSRMEAEKANLVGKTNLQSLWLRWNGGNDTQDIDGMSEQEVLDALEPPPTLKVLLITNYGGQHFSRWLNNANFENLVSIYFYGCRNCLELPTALGKLPSLIFLNIWGMDVVRYVDNESLDNNNNNGQLFGSFLRLEILQIRNLTNLERLSSKRVERSDIFPRLSILEIRGCPKFTSLHCLQSIEGLRIYGCNEAMLKSVSNLHTLTSLDISGNDDLASFPDGLLNNLTHLKSLNIAGFKKLECFPMGIFQGLNSLKSICIMYCLKLKSLSDSFGDLIALQSLEISRCPELETFPNGLHNLSSLQHLTLSGYLEFNDDQLLQLISW